MRFLLLQTKGKVTCGSPPAMAVGPRQRSWREEEAAFLRAAAWLQELIQQAGGPCWWWLVWGHLSSCSSSFSVLAELDPNQVCCTVGKSYSSSVRGARVMPSTFLLNPLWKESGTSAARHLGQALKNKIRNPYDSLPFFEMGRWWLPLSCCSVKKNTLMV